MLHKRIVPVFVLLEKRNFRLFLSNYLPLKEGSIIDIENWEVIGKHQGVFIIQLVKEKVLMQVELMDHIFSW